MTEHLDLQEQHPRTFDEVIERGFRDTPHHKMREGHDMHEHMAHVPVALAPKLDPSTVTVTRKSATQFSDAEQRAFKAAVQKMAADGTYTSIIRLHMEMSHNMHGSMGAVGLYRFLAWHRRYLVEFERALQQADAALRPGAVDQLGVPYWPWQDPFPAWLDGFLPVNDPVSGNPPPARRFTPPSRKPDATDIEIIVNQFQIQTPNVSPGNDYVKFTWGLEGWGKRPDGSMLRAHNHGHSWIGGIMNNTSTSPTDPVFWMHHGEIDRLWEIWRQTHPSPAPPLSGTNRILDPWSESYDDVLNTNVLGYRYDSLQLP